MGKTAEWGWTLDQDIPGCDWWVLEMDHCRGTVLDSHGEPDPEDWDPGPDVRVQWTIFADHDEHLEVGQGFAGSVEEAKRIVEQHLPALNEALTLIRQLDRASSEMIEARYKAWCEAHPGWQERAERRRQEALGKLLRTP